MKYLSCLILGYALWTTPALAAVTISEIAWMGDSESPNHEWIELHNDGPAQTLDGWQLTDGGSITIDLTGSIPSGGYVVLERTSDESAPGTAFLLYTGALKNSGATLTLYRPDGGVEDRVNGGENWESLGGDNTTKETAQYTTSGWVTAPATPGGVNETFTVTAEAEEKTTTSVSNSSPRLAKPSKNESITLELPGDVLELEIEAPEQVFVNQPVSFAVLTDGVGDTLSHSLKYRWNFGDTNISHQKDTTHTFTYPGTYMMHVSASYGTQDADTTHEITVLPVNLSLTTNQAGDVQINNDARYQVDLSGYRLRAHDVIDLPENTWLLPRQTITVPHSKVEANDHALVALYDPKGTMVASILPSRFAAPAVVSAPASVETPSTPVVSVGREAPAESAFQFAATAQAAETADATLGEAPLPPPGSTEPPPLSRWPFLALVLLLSLGCVVVLVQPMLKQKGLDTHE